MRPESTIPFYRCASFWKRLCAYGYDSLFVTILAIFVGWFLGSAAQAQTPQMEQLQQQIQLLVSLGWLPPGTDANNLAASLGPMLSTSIHWSDFLPILLISAAYNIFFLTGSWQATPGKRFCGIYVVSAEGHKLTLAQSALRHATSGISALFFYLPALTILFTRDKLAVHDMICGTRVVLGKTGV